MHVRTLNLCIHVHIMVLSLYKNFDNYFQLRKISKI
jgi:hypothetical protein